MKAKINLRVEILDGEDEGYIFEEANRVIELEDDKIIPHKISISFVTPGQFRKKWIPLPGSCKKEDKNEQ